MTLRHPKVVLPGVALAVSLLTAALLVAARQDVTPQRPVILPPLVRIATVTSEAVTLTVRTQGSVTPRTESDLVPEVAGRVTWMSPSLVAGGFFAEGETLLRIDPIDYRVARDRAQAAADARQSEQRVTARQLARSRQLAGDGLISAREQETAENAAALAAASLREGAAALEQAERDLERTALLAPFAGRVREEQVDVGQFVSRGTSIGKIYAVDWAEVRLPITADDVAFLSLPLDYRDETAAAGGPAVVVRARFAGAEHAWEGRVVRTEGELDPRSRMVHVVARVEDPYGRGSAAGRPPLAVGMFVEAEIQGRTVPEVIVLPRAALRGTHEVLVVDGDDRLRLRAVDVLRRDGDRVVIRAGLTAGDRVCLSQLEAFVDGMKVRTVAAPS